MARFKTVMIETGIAIVDSVTGKSTVTLESPFLQTPVISINTSPNNVDSVEDLGSDILPSFNVNAFVSGVSNSSGLWTFTINSEPKGNITVIQDGQAGGPLNKDYRDVQFIWRAIGPVSAT